MRIAIEHECGYQPDSPTVFLFDLIFRKSASRRDEAHTAKRMPQESPAIRPPRAFHPSTNIELV